MARRDNIVVGRSRDCDLVLRDPTVSGRHARLVWKNGKILVEDLGSANGTFVDGKRIERQLVRPGDELRFGRAPLQWSDRALKRFLRLGGGDTVQGLTIPGRRFICGSCGTRGVMPPAFKGGILRCGACGQRLIVEKPKRRPASAAITAVALVAAGLLAFWIWGGEGGRLDKVAERLLPSGGSASAASPQEASIRVHTLSTVTGAIDATHPRTRNTAARVAAGAEGPFRVEQVARIWSFVRGKWRYVNDPRRSEYFAPASVTIGNDFVGDCDDFAIVLAAMLNAIGGESRVVMMDGPQGGHAYAEVCVPGPSQTVRDRLKEHYDENRYPNLGRQRVRSVHYRPGHECPVWLNLDWNAGVPGGPYEPERWAVAIYPDGRTETLAPFQQSGAPPVGGSTSSSVASPP